MMNFSFSTLSLFPLAVSLSIALSSCSSPEEKFAAQGWWTGDKVAGAPKITIDLNRQVVRYTKGGKLVGAAPISSGKEGHNTVRGQYRIIEKDAEHRSSLYGSFVTSDGRIVDGDVDARRDKAPPGTHFLGASMRSFMRITGGIGMHEGYLPGFAASHGCIRLPSRMAAIFYRATPLGTPVEIVGSAPDGHLTTWLPVPHKLRPEDIVIAPKQEGDTRPKAQVAIAEPPPPPAPPKPKVVEKPIVVVAAAPAPKPAMAAQGKTQLLESAPPARVVVAEAGLVSAGSPEKKSSWFGFGEKGAVPESEPVVVAAAPPKSAPVVAEAPQKISYQPLSSLDQKSSWFSKKPVAAKAAPKAAPKKAAAPRGQTYFLPGYD
jgi:hypothetical protein